MFDNSKRAFIAINDEAEVCLIPKMANRHGLIIVSSSGIITEYIKNKSEQYQVSSGCRP